MPKFICSICGYVHEGMTAPEKCPICKSPSSQFTPSEEYSEDENKGVLEEGNIDGSANESQSFDQSQFNAQDTIVEEKENNSIDSVASEEDKIVKIAETAGINNAIKWYKESNNCDTYEAIETVKSICSQHKVFCTLDDEKEILNFDAARLQAVKWYKEKYDCGLKEAKDVVDMVFAKHGKQTIDKNGCIITILIAITTTLSVFYLI